MILLSDTEPSVKKEQHRLIEIKTFDTEHHGPTKQEKIDFDQEEENTSEKLEQMYIELKNIEKQKTQLIEQTKTEVNTLKAQWEQEKTDLIKNAKEVGFTKGFDIGKEESIKQYEGLLSQANSIIELAQQDYEQSLEKAQEDILSLSVHIAKRIIRNTLNDDPKSFMPLVSEAINEVKDQTNVSIYLHPENYKTVIEQKHDLLQVLGPQVELSIFIDYELQPNDCVIEHTLGQIDASVDTQLKTIKDILEELRIENKC